MGKRANKPASVTAPYLGEKVGTKSNDRRWRSPDGEEWDSKFEYAVYRTYREAGKNIIRCTKTDTFSYVVPVRKASCLSCGGTTIGQQRSYTPDFRVIPSDKQPSSVPYYLEVKGYLRPAQRALYRAFRKTHKDTDIRFIFQANHPAGKGGILDWVNKYMKGCPAVIWKGEVPKFERQEI